MMDTREKAYRALCAGEYRFPKKDGFTALTYAAYRGLGAVVESLIHDFRRGVNDPDANQHTALYTASLANQAAIVRKLLEWGADPDRVAGRAQLTPLMVAAYKGHAEIVQIMLLRRANVHVVSPRRGETALFCAAGGGHLNCVELVLRVATPESIWKRTHTGLCAVDAALDCGHWDVSKYLLRMSEDDHWRRKEDLARCLARLVHRLGIDD